MVFFIINCSYEHSISGLEVFVFDNVNRIAKPDDSDFHSGQVDRATNITKFKKRLHETDF